MTPVKASAILASAALFAGCSHPVMRTPTITGSSQTLVVQGEYEPVALDRIEGLSLDGSRLVLRSGSGSDVIEDLPGNADPAQPNRHWALVTEHATAGKRIVTFTHDISLDEFTIELPASDAELHYGVLASPNGGDVMVLAWGDNGKSYWAWVTIAKK